MSETAAVESSAPTPTAEIASQVIESFESSAPVESASPTESTPAPTEAAPKEELSPAAQFLVSQGHKWGKRPDGKTDLAWLPASTVVKMLDGYLGQHKSTWEGERGTLEQQRKEYLEALTEYRAAISGDPQAYLSELAKFDQRYAAFLQQQQQQQAAAEPMADMPQPDVDLGNGQRTYSIEGLKKLLEWNTQQAERKFEERLKPLTEREQKEKERIEAEKIQAARTERHQKLLADAQTWPLFGKFPDDGSLTPFQQEVFAALQADKSLDLRGAWMKVALPRLSERKQLLEEINSAPKAPTVGRAGHETPSVPKTSDTKSIAARTLARLESGS